MSRCVVHIFVQLFQVQVLRFTFEHPSEPHLHASGVSKLASFPWVVPVGWGVLGGTRWAGPVGRYHVRTHVYTSPATRPKLVRPFLPICSSKRDACALTEKSCTPSHKNTHQLIRSHNTEPSTAGTFPHNSCTTLRPTYSPFSLGHFSPAH